MENSTIPCETTTEEGYSGVLYTINNSQITYTYFIINIITIAFHLIVIILNSLMIIALRRTKKVEESGGHCLICLSSAYIWLCIMMIYTSIYGLLNIQNKFECLLRYGLFHSAFFCITWTNCQITVDRFLQIQFPFWHKKHVHPSTVWMASWMAFGVTLFISLSPLMFQWYRPPVTRKRFCEYFNVFPPEYLELFAAITLFGFFLEVVVYAKLLCLASSHSSMIRKNCKISNSKSSIRKRSLWKPLRVAVTVAGVYLLCWSPPGLYLICMLSDRSYPKKSQPIIKAIVVMIPSISGLINPYLFALHREVKYKFFQLIGCKKACEKMRRSVVVRASSRSMRATTYTDELSMTAFINSIQECDESDSASSHH